jgi:hypothetical protein
MTGRQEFDRTKDRQRILDEYMIDKKVFPKMTLNPILFEILFFLSSVLIIWGYRNFLSYRLVLYKSSCSGSCPFIIILLFSFSNRESPVFFLFCRTSCVVSLFCQNSSYCSLSELHKLWLVRTKILALSPSPVRTPSGVSCPVRTP